MIYEYECVKCKLVFEIHCKLKDKDNPVECPECNANQVKRVYSPPPRHFSWGSWNPLD